MKGENLFVRLGRFCFQAFVERMREKKENFSKRRETSYVIMQQYAKNLWQESIFIELNFEAISLAYTLAVETYFFLEIGKRRLGKQ